MNVDSSHPAIVSHSYFRTHQDPIEHASEIVGVRMIRHPDTLPSEPLEVAIDRSAIAHMGWRPGDAITLIPVPGREKSHEGKLIIRKAEPGEFALILGELPEMREGDCEGIASDEVHGLHFEWHFPASWNEWYFPGRYDDEDGDFNSTTERCWPLVAILGQVGQIKLPLGPEELFLYLQRTSPSPTTLDVHLIPGLMHQMGWSTRTPLVLESDSGFDPFASEDVLTIRENSLGEEPNLDPAKDRFVAEVNPLWLDRFFPDHFYPSGGKERDRGELGPDEDEDHPAVGSQRHTVVVGYAELSTKAYALSLRIALPGRDLSA